MKIAAVQLTPSTEPHENLEKMRHFAGLAAAEGADMIVFPEQTMALLSAATPENLVAMAEEWWHQFVDLAAELAAQHDAVIVVAGFEPGGSTSESLTSASASASLTSALASSPSTSAAASSSASSSLAVLPFNTMIAIAPDGTELAKYRKLHLYEAFSASESEHTQAGTELPPVFQVTGGRAHGGAHSGAPLTFGLANCYDVRFPEVFRSLAERGANAFIIAAAWASGPEKEAQWSLLTRARAVENVGWVVASATVGGGRRNTATTGLSSIVDPFGTVVAGLGGRAEGVVVTEVDADSVDRARATLPALANRRIRLSYEVN